MKKFIFVILLAVMLVAMPSIASFQVPSKNNHSIKLKNLNQQLMQNDTPPDWAKGNFSGVWGLNFLGLPLKPAGWIKGYFANQPGLGRLEAEFAEFNVTNATGIIGGYMIWIFFLGFVGSAETGNGTYVAGIGVANETHFYWRLNAIIGPSYYIHCEYTKFET